MENKISTIQLNENVKRMLAEMKEKSSDSYENIIVKLIEEKKKNKKELAMLLKEQCEEMYGTDIEIAKEWDGTLLDGLNSDEYQKNF